MKLISSIALFFTIISTYANTAEFPSGEKSYYSSTEPSLFKNDCTLTSTDKMSCVVSQLFFVSDITGTCQISWTTHKDQFTYDKEIKSWVSVKNHNNECGVITLSSFKKNEKGYWIYRFKTQITSPDSKSKILGVSCKKFEDNDWVEYSTEIMHTNVSCKNLMLLP